MSAGRGGSPTLDGLARVLEERGLAELAARRVAADWAAHYPLVSRSGALRVARSLERLGLAPESALEAAGIMLGIELQLKGAAFQRVLEDVERAGIPASCARSAALEAVALRRASTPPGTAESRSPAPLAFLPIGVGAAALVLARLLLLAS